MITYKKIHILIALLPHFLFDFSECFPNALVGHKGLFSTRHGKHRWDIDSLFGGVGIAKDYSWREDQFEIELKIPIPLETKQSDVLFKASLQSIHLSIRTNSDPIELVDSSRELKGRIDIDGTFWSFSESESTDSMHTTDHHSQKFIVVHIEKLIPSSSASDQFDVVEYDWGGVYRDDEKEVISKKYKEPEVLNVREYAASLGVDIDNIDMSKVDKNMFTSGLNMTRSSLDELCKVGYAKEVTRQNDGSEFVVDVNSGDSIPFDFLGKQVGRDEITTAAIDDTMMSMKSPTTTRNERSKRIIENPSVMNDPIELLTFDKLRDILEVEGISTEELTTEAELRSTLKKHIQVKLSKRKKSREDPKNSAP